MSYNYIRVAAMISDPYTRVSKIHSVAFKSSDGTSGPFGSMGNMTATNKAEFIQFVGAAQKTLGGAHIDDGPHKEMFVPDTNARATTVDVPTNMIAFHERVYAHQNDTAITELVSPVENTSQKYYVYIYARNDTGYEFIQPSDVVLVV